MGWKKKVWWNTGWFLWTPGFSSSGRKSGDSIPWRQFELRPHKPCQLGQSCKPGVDLAPKMEGTMMKLTSVLPLLIGASLCQAMGIGYVIVFGLCLASLRPPSLNLRVSGAAGRPTHSCRVQVRRVCHCSASVIHYEKTAYVLVFLETEGQLDLMPSTIVAEHIRPIFPLTHGTTSCIGKHGLSGSLLFLG